MNNKLLKLPSLNELELNEMILAVEAMNPLDDRAYRGELFAYKYSFFLAVVSMFGFIAPNIWFYLLGCAASFWSSPRIANKQAYENLSVREIIGALAANNGKDWKQFTAFGNHRFLKGLKWYLLLVTPVYSLLIPLRMDIISGVQFCYIATLWHLIWIATFCYIFKSKIEVLNLECYEKLLIRQKQGQAVQDAQMWFLPKKVKIIIKSFIISLVFPIFLFMNALFLSLFVSPDYNKYALTDKIFAIDSVIGTFLYFYLISSCIIFMVFFVTKTSFFRNKTLLIVKFIKKHLKSSI